ncbi:hypothetical protein DM02DRAFT_536949 [Periconia macrospinosa]|uniref:CFEM domain-containing protein n=1 Tax=Periconia macrospinosa TaxID=97972 RepID=A0A2V1DDE9_9PLEO|nr:hypothetical protein DM02DRAFT_536949 [Periconia macrospinosa]
MISPRVLILLLVSLCATSFAQSADLPLCALQCLMSAFNPDTCTSTDQTCMCTNPVFQNNVTMCVSSSCTVIEALATRNISLTTCGAPIRNRGQDYVILSTSMVVIAAAFVIIRFAFKAIITGWDFDYDDWCVLVTMISAVPSVVITIYGTVKHGLGQDLWVLSPHDITHMIKYFYLTACLYFAQVALTKLTLVLFYTRVFPNKDVQRLLWGTVVFLALWGFAYVITAIFQCQPISYFWTKWDGLHKGKCLDPNIIGQSNAGVSIALDFWILGIPLWQLWGLKMHWKKKVGVALMFCVGMFVTVVSIVRLKALVHFAASYNASWEFYGVSKWSSIEIGVGIMCACLPSLRLVGRVLVRLFPILGSTTSSNQQYHDRDSGNELKEISNNRKFLKTSSAVTSPRPGVFSEEEGVTVKRSFAVEYGQKDDEASLVSHGKSSS